MPLCYSENVSPGPIMQCIISNVYANIFDTKCIKIWQIAFFLWKNKQENLNIWQLSKHINKNAFYNYFLYFKLFDSKWKWSIEFLFLGDFFVFCRIFTIKHNNILKNLFLIIFKDFFRWFFFVLHHKEHNENLTYTEHYDKLNIEKHEKDNEKLNNI